MKRICVYCGSNVGSRAAYADAARELGRVIADAGLGLVYGAGNVGLMHVVAEAALRAGGEVIGLIPRSLADKELAHEDLTELIVVESMHERKQGMADRSDGFIALPGGIGTLEEVVEVFTWLQLEFHSKPIGLLNVAGFYDRLLEFLEHMSAEGFLLRAQVDMLLVDDDPGRLLDRMRRFKPIRQEKWIDRRRFT
ncbi:MAG: TIGR00730 family Rossman fold protein [Verrucomicrobiae bacterium]|nr:TIGR00730 family Rossman fold protein [Verrucomicrobiae bacterium]